MDNQLTPKSFWEKPEGQTGKLFLILFLIAVGYAFFKFLPLILVLLQNTIYAMVLLGIIGIILFLLLDPRFRNLLSYGYKMVMRFITGLIIQLDPIAIIEGYIQDLKKKRESMDQQIGNLRGQMVNLQNEMNDNTKNINNNLKLASVAKERGKTDATIINARKAGRLKDSNISINELYTKMEKLYRILAKMFEASNMLIEDIEDEVKVKKRERKAILAGYSAFNSARKILKGDSDKQDIFNQAMEFIKEDLGAKVGEIDRFMEISSTILDNADLQNGVNIEEGFNLLEKWEKEGTSMLLGDHKNIILAQANNVHDVLDLNQPIVVSTKKNRYSDLLE